MINLDLKGRRPDELADKETCEDILLELKDTGFFDIRWVNLNGGGFRANNKAFENWVERGQVAMYELDETTLPRVSTDSFAEYSIKVKEKRYDIFRHPIRLNVEYKTNGDYRSNQRSERLKEINQISDDVYQRLKDYIGPDIIQDQFLYTNFQIDFMLSSIKVI